MKCKSPGPGADEVFRGKCAIFPASLPGRPPPFSGESPEARAAQAAIPEAVGAGSFLESYFSLEPAIGKECSVKSAELRLTTFRE